MRVASTYVFRVGRVVHIIQANEKEHIQVVKRATMGWNWKHTS